MASCNATPAYNRIPFSIIGHSSTIPLISVFAATGIMSEVQYLAWLSLLLVKLAVGTYEGMLHFIDLNSGYRSEYSIGTANILETRHGFYGEKRSVYAGSIQIFKLKIYIDSY